MYYEVNLETYMYCLIHFLQKSKQWGWNSYEFHSKFAELWFRSVKWLFQSYELSKGCT